MTKAEEFNQLGYNLMYNGNPKDSISYFDQAVLEDPMYIAAYINKGRALASLEQYKDAKEEFLKARKIEKNNEDVLFDLANVCYLQREYKEGIQYANDAIANGCVNDALYYNTALAYEEMDEKDTAIRFFNKAIQINPLEAKYYVHKSHIQVAQQKWKEALHTLEILNHNCPESFESYHYSFLIYLQMQDYEKADSVINLGLQRFPGDVSLYYDKLRILNIVREFDEAMELIELLPKLPGFEIEERNILIEKAKVYLQTDRLEEAIETLEKVMAFPYIETFEGHYLLMNAYLAKNDYEKCAKIAKAIADADEDSSYARSAYYYYPMALMKQGKDEEAKSAYKKAEDKLRFISLRRPRELDTYLFRALCFKDCKEYDKALEVLDYALKLKNDYAPAHAIKGNVYKDMGKTEDAKKEFDMAQQMNDIFKELFAQI